MATTSRFLSRLKPLALSPSRPCPPRSRDVHIRATPSTSSIDGPVDLSEQTQAIPKLSGDGPFPADVQFEVLGAPYSLLSIALPASSTLYSRRGTLAGINGKVEDAVSTLSLLEPFRRASLGIPFLYQKISSISPLTCLISTNSPNTTFGVIQLDGKIDWMVTQRKALLAWTGHSISVRPTLNRRLSLAHWGSSKLTGRGLVALIGKGQIYQATLKPGEEFVVHPNHLLAYSINSTASRPAPYRIKSSVLKFQIPSLKIGRFLPEVKFFKVLRNTDTWKTLSRILFAIRTWSRRTIWGDRLFLRFQGPGTLLLQSRASRISDVLTPTDVNEFAKVQPGTQLPISSKYADNDDDAGENVAVSENKYTKISAPEREQREPAALKMVTVKDGKVEFQDSDFRKDFSR